jgi:hypothetical protein
MIVSTPCPTDRQAPPDQPTADPPSGFPEGDRGCQGNRPNSLGPMLADLRSSSRGISVVEDVDLAANRRR